MGKSKFLAENTVMRYLFTGLLLFSCLFAQGATQDSVEQVLTNYFQELGKTPQEKLYLHLDKSYYGAGETIWFKGYLLNAITHRDNSPSNYIYVELVDKGDSVLYRYKYKRDTVVGFRGAFPVAGYITRRRLLSSGLFFVDEKLGSRFFLLQES